MDSATIKTIIVPCVALFRNDHLLVAYHKNTQEVEFPGGKLEQGESPMQGLVREVQEELGVTLNPKACYRVSFTEAQVGSTIFVVILYLCLEWSGEPYAKEGQTIAWVHKTALDSLNWLESDLEMIRMVMYKLELLGK